MGCDATNRLTGINFLIRTFRLLNHCQLGFQGSSSAGRTAAQMRKAGTAGAGAARGTARRCLAAQAAALAEEVVRGHRGSLAVDRGHRRLPRETRCLTARTVMDQCGGA